MVFGALAADIAVGSQRGAQGRPAVRPAAEFVLAWYCGLGALYEIASGTWKKIPPPDGEIFGRPVSAGPVVLFAGAAHEGHANALWAHKP